MCTSVVCTKYFYIKNNDCLFCGKIWVVKAIVGQTQQNTIEINKIEKKK